MSEDVSKNRSQCPGCDFAIFSHSHDLGNLTKQIGIDADWSLPPAVQTFGSRDIAANSDRRGCWLIRSKDRVVSQDVNAHLRYLLSLLLPHREMITAVAQGGVAVFTVHWVGQVYPYDCGPAIAIDCVAGIAALDAEIAFTLHTVPQTNT